MPVDGVMNAIIAVVLAVLVLALASGRRDADRVRAGERPSGWRGSAVWLGIFGASSGASHADGDSLGGDDHGVGGDWSGSHGGGDYGGGGWGGGDSGGGDSGGGGDGGGGGGGGD